MSNISVSEQLRNSDPDRLLLPNAPAWYENERNMRITGIALIVIGAVGVVLGAAAIALGAMGLSMGALPAVGLIGVGVGGIVASVAVIATGIFLLKKDYWNDQSFVDQQSLHAMKMPFDQLIQTFGWEKVQGQHLISTRAVRGKFFDKIEHMEYSSVIQQHRFDILQQRFIAFSELKPKLVAEAHNMTAPAFKAKYGDQPVVDGVIDATDTFYVDMIKRAIRILAYHRICQEYGTEYANGIITKQDITNALQAQCAGKSFSTVYQEQGNSHFWNIIKDGILPPEQFRGLLQEVAHLPLSTIIERYSWNILDQQLVERAELTPFAVRECQQIATFEEIVQRFGDTIFTRQIVSRNDAIIAERVRDLCRRIPFCTLIDSYQHILLPHQLLIGVDQLLNQKIAIDERLSASTTAAERAYSAACTAAASARDIGLTTTLHLKASARRAVENENSTHRQSLERIRAQIANEEVAHRRTIQEMKTADPYANCDAEIGRHAAQMQQLRQLQAQEESRHMLQISFLQRDRRSASAAHRQQVAAVEQIYTNQIQQAKIAQDNQIAIAQQLHSLERAALDAQYASRCL